MVTISVENLMTKKVIKLQENEKVYIFHKLISNNKTGVLDSRKHEVTQ